MLHFARVARQGGTAPLAAGKQMIEAQPLLDWVDAELWAARLGVLGLLSEVRR